MYTMCDIVIVGFARLNFFVIDQQDTSKQFPNKSVLFIKQWFSFWPLLFFRKATTSS